MRKRGRARKRDGGDVLKGLAAGVVGGLVASWVMEEFQAGWSKVSEGLEASQKSSKKKQKSGDSGEEQEPATVKAAEAISENIFDHRLTKSEKKIAGPAMHYATGATSGAIYGVAAEFMPFVSVGAGLPFGAAVWLIADDAALPALGLSKSPTEYPLSTHAYALASHLVYGLTTDVVRRALRSAME
jgi:putative membrane protein